MLVAVHAHLLVLYIKLYFVSFCCKKETVKQLLLASVMRRTS